MTNPFDYLSRLPFPALSRPPRRMPIAPDETGGRAVLRLDDRLRAELHQQARLLVQSPVLLRQRAGERIAREHSHDYWEISFVIQGALRNRLTDGSEETLSAGSVMLIAPGTAHSLLAGTDGTAMFNFMLDADHAEKLCWLHGLEGLSAFAREQRLERAAPECLYCMGETGRLWAIATEIRGGWLVNGERYGNNFYGLSLPKDGTILMGIWDLDAVYKEVEVANGTPLDLSLELAVPGLEKESAIILDLGQICN